MSTLWDLLKQAIARPGRARPQRPPAQGAGASHRNTVAPPHSSEPMQARYDRVTREMLAKYGVRVRRWRSGMSGIAWEVVYHDGRVNKLIEAPRPKGPMSAAVFLHEIGHHAIGFGVYRPRCLEEYHAWVFALGAMEELGLNVTDSVRRRMHDSLHYAVGKARRRGLRILPVELEPFVRAWPRKGRRVEREDEGTGGGAGRDTVTR